MYPATNEARDRFILDRRHPRPANDPWHYQGLTVEDERTPDGEIVRVATVFLTGRECPWRCVTCDLWQYTTLTDTPSGAIEGQLATARQELARRAEPVASMKLYNAANFFDPRAVPDGDYPGIAAALAGLDRVIVESHPALISARVDRFLDALAAASNDTLPPRLEVAMGLETAHPEALDRLNKRMTVDDFAKAADTLKMRAVALRVFLLIHPPFIPVDQQDDWLARSIDVAFLSGATAVSLIPTRTGNGALEALSGSGEFRAPSLEEIERSAQLALTASPRGRVFVDLWDLQRFADCNECFDTRLARLRTLNLEQRWQPLPACGRCSEGGEA